MAETKTKKEKIIGIDLGTSNSAASVLQAGKPVIIPSAEGITQYGKAFPSVVAFTKDGHLLVGEPARRQAVSNPEGTILAAKRKMGTTFKYNVHGQEYTPQQISAFLLQKIKKTRRPLILTHRGRSAAIVEDVKEYENRLERLELLEAIVRGLQAAEKGELVSHKDAMRKLDDLLKA